MQCINVTKVYYVSFPLMWPGFDRNSSDVGHIVDKMTLGQVSSEYFRFPCQFPFINHPIIDAIRLDLESFIK
jgi:hypothetical protein